MTSWWRPFWKARRSTAPAKPGEACSLSDCLAGSRATILCVTCPAHDAGRLRALGVFEGARVEVVDTANGMLLAVCGSRVALDAAVATSITVREVVP